MANIFCTLAMGERYAGYARFLADDLRDFGQTLVVVTDQPDLFRSCRNVVVTPHYPKSFSYHDKRLALRAALDLEETAIFLDADSAIRFGAPKDLVREALAYRCPPGLLGLQIHSAASYHFSHIEDLAKSWGLSYDRTRAVYMEGLFALRKEEGKEQRFFEIWDRFYEEAQQRGDPGAGEGICFGIAALAAGLTCHNTHSMKESRLPNILWHTQLNWRLRRLYHLKFNLKSRLGLQPPTDWNAIHFCGLSDDPAPK